MTAASREEADPRRTATPRRSRIRASFARLRTWRAVELRRRPARRPRRTTSATAPRSPPGPRPGSKRGEVGDSRPGASGSIAGRVDRVSWCASRVPRRSPVPCRTSASDARRDRHSDLLTSPWRSAASATVARSRSRESSLSVDRAPELSSRRSRAVTAAAAGPWIAAVSRSCASVREIRLQPALPSITRCAIAARLGAVVLRMYDGSGVEISAEKPAAQRMTRGGSYSCLRRRSAAPRTLKPHPDRRGAPRVHPPRPRGSRPTSPPSDPRANGPKGESCAFAVDEEGKSRCATLVPKLMSGRSEKFLRKLADGQRSTGQKYKRRPAPQGGDRRGSWGTRMPLAPGFYADISMRPRARHLSRLSPATSIRTIRQGSSRTSSRRDANGEPGPALQPEAEVGTRQHDRPPGGDGVKSTPTRSSGRTTRGWMAVRSTMS